MRIVNWYSTGKFGVMVSSERYKTTIAAMGAHSEKPQQLRPVTFHLETDPQSALRYGFVAEEVVKVYPELEIRDASGKIQDVRYDELAPMLLNEVRQQVAEIRDLKQQLAELKDLKQELHAALLKLQDKDEVVAQL
jgi:Chaperone of endosialidase